MMGMTWGQILQGQRGCDVMKLRMHDESRSNNLVLVVAEGHVIRFKWHRISSLCLCNSQLGNSKLG